tara:strand:- start:373 stop:483 length:111 start_codon:yes stop_codon:yes gene_type:complete
MHLIGYSDEKVLGEFDKKKNKYQIDIDFFFRSLKHE